MEEITRVHVKLLKRVSKNPLTGKDIIVKFYDQDLVKDDFLGESRLDAKGHAIVPVTRSDYATTDSPLEKYPDIYFIVERKGKEIYRSAVFKNLDLKEAGNFPASEGFHCDLGTFLIP